MKTLIELLSGVKTMPFKGLFGLLSVALIGGALSSCVGGGDNNKAGSGSGDDGEVSCIQEPTPIKVYFQPLGDFTDAEAQRVAKEFAEEFTGSDSMGVGYITEVLPAVQLSDDMKNDTKRRYRAQKVLDSLKRGGKGECVIGLMHPDIYTTAYNVQDYGIQGLSYIGSHRAVVSTYRTRTHEDFIKVVYHEFCHAYYKLPHCPYDDPTCIIKAGNGRPYWKNKSRLCDKCRVEAARELFGTEVVPCK